MVNWIAFQTLVRKEFFRIFRIWSQTLLPSVITMTLYFLIFGNLIGDRIGNMDGIPYSSYIVPGLIMMAVITNSYSNVVSSFFSAKFQRHIEELLIAPINCNVIIFGFVFGGIIRGMLVGFLVYLVALFFVDLDIQHIFTTLFVAFITAALFSLAGLINGIFSNKFDDVSIIPTFVLTPLTYLGGVFYSINLLPKSFQYLTLSNPIFYMVNAFRYGLFGKADISLEFALLMLTGFTVGLYLVTRYLIVNGIGLKT